MLASRNIIWSEEKFSLIDLLHSSPSLEYPLLVKVVQSHCAGTTEDNYNPEEMFVFYGWGKQERVLAENADKVSISIPTSHEHKLSVSVDNPEQSKNRVTLPLSSILTIHSPPLRVEFDPGVTSIFYVGSTLFNSNDFGPMVLKSSHMLEYAKCSPITQGKVNMDALHVLPTSLNLICVVARGLSNGLDLDTVLKGVQEEAAFLMDSPVDQKLVGICGYYDLLPHTDETYEFIESISAGPWSSQSGCTVTNRSSTVTELPSTVETIHQGDYATASRRNDPPKHPLYHAYTFLDKSKLEVRAEDQLSREPTTPTKIRPSISEMGSGIRRSPQKIVRRGPRNDKTMSDHFMKELEEKLSRPKVDISMAMAFNEIPVSERGVPYPPPTDTSPTPRFPPSPPLPPKDPLGPPPPIHKNPFIPPRPRRQDSTSSSDQENISSISSKPRRQDSTSSSNQGPVSTPIGTVAHGEVSPQSLTDSAGVRGRRITSSEHVPEDISSLNVQEVCDCLRLLKLDNHIQQFTDNLVDGRRLLTCSADDLKTDFGFTTIGAYQVEQFVKDGWRPKMNS